MADTKIKNAWDTDLKKALLMTIDEVVTAYRGALEGLSDERFAAFPIEGRHCIATLTYHCLQQADAFNSLLIERYGEAAPKGSRFLQAEERFELWGVPEENWPKPGDAFPSVNDARASLDAISRSLLANLERLTAEELAAPAPHRWPRLCDMYFRMANHCNAHIRQIWALRGAMGLVGKDAWPEQNWA